MAMHATSTFCNRYFIVSSLSDFIMVGHPISVQKSYSWGDANRHWGFFSSGHLKTERLVGRRKSKGEKFLQEAAREDRTSEMEYIW